MNLEIFTFILANTITCTIFLKYIIKQKITMEYQEKLDLVLHKINSLDLEVSELHETLDILEELLHKKHIDMRQSQEVLSSKIDSYIISNYDIT